MDYVINDNTIWSSSDFTWAATGGTDWACGSSEQTPEEILDKLDIRDIETYLRKKKIDRIKNGIN